MPEQNIDGSDRTGRRNVKRIEQPISCNRLAHGLQVGTRQHHKSVIAQNARKLLYDLRNFMSVNVLNVMGGKNCIKRTIANT